MFARRGPNKYNFCCRKSWVQSLALPTELPRQLKKYQIAVREL